MMLVLVGTGAMACGLAGTDADPTPTPSATSTSGTSSGTGGSDITGCEGPTPLCADGCGSDYFPESASCVNGAWICPGDTVLPEDCPPGTCWGVPLPGEICGPDGWSCEPEPEVIDACPGLICAVCDGFEGPIDTPSCHCACEDGQVICTPQELPPCEGLEPCECFARADCTPVTDTCICPCDYACPGEPPCDCDCGGGNYLGCENAG